ncbi:universal stress protein [Kitasatospora griseola]|uniref:universal stress protein n=1 Tax=Kitasatospora griseola TaxID=2064 RepID=UPI0038559E23
MARPPHPRHLRRRAPSAERWARQQLVRQGAELRGGLSGVEVSAVHVPEDSAKALETASAAAPTELEGDAQRRPIEALEPAQRRHPDVPVTPYAIRGPRTLVVVEAADEAEPLALGRRTRHVPSGPHLGPVTQAAPHHARCPVAVGPCS